MLIRQKREEHSGRENNVGKGTEHGEQGRLSLVNSAEWLQGRGFVLTSEWTRRTGFGGTQLLSPRLHLRGTDGWHMWSPKSHLERWISREPGGARELMPWGLEKPGNPSAYSHPFPRSSAPSPYSWGSDDHSSASPLDGKRNLLHTSLKICKQWRLAHAGDIRDAGSIPGLGIPPEEGMATHSSIFAWRLPMDRGAWWAPVQGSQSWTRLKRLSARAQAFGCLVPSLSSHILGSACGGCKTGMATTVCLCFLSDHVSSLNLLLRCVVPGHSSFAFWRTQQ